MTSPQVRNSKAHAHPPWTKPLDLVVWLKRTATKVRGIYCMQVPWHYCQRGGYVLSNSNARGSSKDRAARKAWLLKTYQSDAGKGTCRCYRCGCVLTTHTVTVDRITPGCHGGRYVRNNIRPACSRCNNETGLELRWK